MGLFRVVGLLVCLGLVSCATTPEKLEETSPPEPAFEFQLPLPPHTLGLVRLDPQRFNHAASCSAAKLQLADEADCEKRSPTPPDDAQPGSDTRKPAETTPRTSSAVRRLLAAPDSTSHPFHKLFSWPTLDTKPLAGIDPAGDLFIAVSGVGNQEIIERAAEFRPAAGDALLDRGLGVRLIVAALDASALEAAIRSHCDQDAASCPGLALVGHTQVEGKRGYVTVDLVVGAADDERPAAYAEELKAAEAEPDDAYATRPTPALRAFVDADDAAVAAFARTSDLWSMLVAAQATLLPGHDKDRGYELRRAVAPRRFATLVDIAVNESAALRDFEDVALSLVEDASEGFRVNIVRTKTDRGSRRAEAPAVLPSVSLEDANLWVDYSRSLGSSPEARPRFFDFALHSEQRDPRWTRSVGLAAWLEHPNSLWWYEKLRTREPARSMLDPDKLFSPQLLVRVARIDALRGAFHVPVSGEKPKAVLVFRAPAASNLDAVVELLAARLRQQENQASVQVKVNGDDMEVRVLVNAGAAGFGAATRIDETRVRTAFEDEHPVLALENPNRRSQSKADDDWIVALVNQVLALERFELRRSATTSSETLAFGFNTAPEAPAVGAASVALLEERVPTQCERALEFWSWRAVEVGAMRRDHYLDEADDVIVALENLQTTCDTPRARHQLAAWLAYLGGRHSQVSYASGARKLFSKACELGDAAACRRKEQMDKQGVKVELPVVYGYPGRVDNVIATVGADGLSVSRPGNEEASVSLSAAFGSSGDEIPHIKSSSSHTMMVLDAATPASAVRDLSVRALLGDRYDPSLEHTEIEAMVTGRRQMVRVFSWMVELPYGHGLGLVQVETKPGPRRANNPPKMTVHVKTTGIEVSVDGKTVAPIAGCPKGGPTVCNRSSSDVGEQARLAWSKFMAGEAVDARKQVAEVVEMYRFDALDEVVGKLAEELEEPPLNGPSGRAADLVVDDDVPFAVLAKVVSSMRSSPLEGESYTRPNRTTRRYYPIYLEVLR